MMKLDDQDQVSPGTEKKLKRRSPSTGHEKGPRERFKKTNSVADIEEAIALHRWVCPTGHPDRLYWSLSSLASRCWAE